MPTSEKVLIVLLRLTGILMLPAFLAVFLPTSSMEAIHARLEIGPFPEAPLTEYLTRSLSLFYAMQGAILLLLSTNVRRYAPVIELLAWLALVFGPVLFGIDYLAPMPRSWTLLEGPAAVVLGVLILWLVRRVERR